MSTVAIVKIEEEEIDAAVRKAIDLLGGIEMFISSEKEVLIKPNLLSAPEKKETREKIITDLRVVEAIVKILSKKKKKIIIGDCSGVGEPGGTRKVLRKSGYLELAKRYPNVVVQSLEKNGPINANVNGKKLKTANIAKDVVEAQAIINVPKMKTHSLTIFTGAIKNLFGTITGGDKARIHSLGATLKGFSQCLVDLYSYEKEKIKLNIMDAFIALEGAGPGASGEAVKMGLILASTDAVALDAVAVRIMGLKPEKIPTLQLASEQGLGEIDEKAITILGEKIEKVKRKFKIPLSVKIAFIPFQRFSQIIKRFPKYTHGCTGCKSCVNTCPEKVIEIVTDKRGKPRPIIDFKNCITCYSCIEICPEACYVTRAKNLPKAIAAMSAFVIGFITTIVLLSIFL